MFKDLSQNFISEYAFCTEFGTFEIEWQWHSFLNLHISFEAVTINILLHRTENMRVIWCQVRAVQWIQDTPIKTAVMWLPSLRLCVMQQTMQMVHDIVMIKFNKLPMNFSCKCAFAQRYHITLRTSGWEYTSRLFAILNCSNCAPMMHTWLPHTCLQEQTLSSDVTMQKWHSCLDPFKYLLCIFTSWLTYVIKIYGPGPLCSVP